MHMPSGWLAAAMVLTAVAAHGTESPVPASGNDAFSVTQPGTSAVTSTGPVSEDEIEKFKRLEAAAGRKTPKHYVAPPGFGGHAWGEKFASFTRLNQSPVTLQLAHSPGRVTQVDTICAGECTLEQALLTLRQKVEHRGFHVFGEFVVPNQGFRFQLTGVLMYPVTYQYCGGWTGFDNKPPPDVLDSFKLCGIRMVFKSQTAEEIRVMDDQQLTNYELVLFELMREHGKPYGHFSEPEVTIETPEGLVRQPRKRRMRTWRWCPPLGSEWETSCEASIVLGFNAESGNGVVLFSTPAAWQFAYIRETYVQGHDPMFQFMHGRDQ